MMEVYIEHNPYKPSTKILVDNELVKENSALSLSCLSISLKPSSTPLMLSLLAFKSLAVILPIVIAS